MRRTHHERKERRRAIAERIAAGAGIRETAAEFGVGEGTVRTACREFSVPHPGMKLDAGSSSADMLRVVARLVMTNRSYKDVAAEFGLPAHRVERLAQRCREAGLPVPARPRGSWPRLSHEAPPVGEPGDSPWLVE